MFQQKRASGQFSMAGISNIRTETLLTGAVVLMLLFDLVYFIIGFNNGLMEEHAFRQAQTALSAYWLKKGGPFFAYETPVLGYPWAIPFEFPIYQGVTALIAKTGLGIVPAGRIVSFAAFIGALVPLRFLAKDLGVSRRAFLVVALLYLASPFGFFWGRSVMIESSALFFGLTWFAAFIRFRSADERRVRTRAWIIAFVAGALAVLTKSTTFLGIGAVVGAVILVDAIRWLRIERDREGLWWIALSGLLCALPLALGTIWVAYSDKVKLANPFGTFITSSNLSAWNFGTLGQRLEVFHGPIWRSLNQNFGYGLALVLAAIVFALIVSRNRALILCAIGAYLAPFFIFTNLHVIHTYYQSANSVFAIVAAGLALDALSDAWPPRWLPAAAAVLALVVAGQIVTFHRDYAGIVRHDNIGADELQIALAARAMTAKGDSLLVFGEDWSSVIAFYSERKTLTVPTWTWQELGDRVVSDPQSLLGPARLGGIVDCKDPNPDSYGLATVFAPFLENRRVLATAGRCRLLSAERKAD